MLIVMRQSFTTSDKTTSDQTTYGLLLIEQMITFYNIVLVRFGVAMVMCAKTRATVFCVCQNKSYSFFVLSSF